MRFGLRTRVAVAFGLLSLVIAAAVSGATYGFARWYLLNQREDAALTRAVLDARSVSAALTGGADPQEALEQVPSVGTSQPMVRVDSTWYASGITVPPDQLPASLLEVASVSGGAEQRASVGEDTYFFVAIELSDALYVEVFSLRDLDLTFTIGGWLLFGQTLVAGAVGVLIGRYTVGQVLRPLRRLGAGARRIATGELSTRITLTGDRDLDPIAASFNGMAEAVETRIQRERRFSANVSHELRSPLTSVVGTAELLDRRREELPEREAGLIAVLNEQVTRMSQMLLDLLEISRIGGGDPLQLESLSVRTMCEDAVGLRGLPLTLVHGNDAVVRTDARRFERIVGNLIDNAQRHGGGVVEIAIVPTDGMVDVMVRDEGPGIAPGEIDRLFEPFTRGEDAQYTSGAGLGLAIANEQAGLLGARLRVESVVGEGSSFIITLATSDAPSSLLPASDNGEVPHD